MTRNARSVYLRLVIAVALAVVLTPVAAAFLPETRWHRVATRTFLIELVLLFVSDAGHPRTWIDKLRAIVAKLASEYEADPTLIHGAMRMNLEDLDERTPEELPRDREIVLYCT